MGRTSQRCVAVRISVVIVSYNSREFLLDCLQSVYASTGPIELQVFVVDNASTDGSAEAVRRAFPGCTVIANRDNLGFSRANNLAIARTSGDYVLLLNPDTVLAPDVLDKMTEYMEKNPGVGMASCRLVTAEGVLDLACRRSFPSLWDGFCRASGLGRLFPRRQVFSRYNLTHLDETETQEVDAICGAFMFARRKAVDDVGLLDEDYFMYIEDLDWCYLFRKAGWKVVYHPAVTALHVKGHSANPRSSTMIRELFNSTELFYRKHYFPRMNGLHIQAMLCSLFVWKWTTLLRNALRANKRVRP
jgi:GT2 family glycosyltransferase